jgi:peroxiredoxin
MVMSTLKTDRDSNHAFFKGPACSSTHVPGYISHPKLKEAGQVFVVAVNDPFV